jgi:hypothetical protein
MNLCSIEPPSENPLGAQQATLPAYFGQSAFTESPQARWEALPEGWTPCSSYKNKESFCAARN